MSDEEKEEGRVEQVLTIRIAVSDLADMGFEVRSLREQVSFLQAMGTTQLSASRAACFEAAALECEHFAAEIPQNGQAQIYAKECAAAIRALAKR